MNCCFAKHALTGRPVRVAFDRAIVSIDPAGGAGDTYIAPGWIDLQVNGFAGVDYNRSDTTDEEIARSIQILFSTGVTRFYPTVITGAPQSMEAALRNLSRAKDALPEGEAMDGFHVEGPHISVEDGPRGAHPREWVRKPDIDEFRRWQEATDGRVRIVTVSPEWPEATAYIEKVAGEGVVVSIGHTAASHEQIRDAVAAGAGMSTHLGNGAHSVLRRHPNYLWQQLAEDRLMASFIVDGIHLDAAFLTVALRSKGLERSVLITDAVTPAGLAPGLYRLGELEVELKAEGRVVLRGQDRLAGSALRMDRGVENLMRLTGIPLASAVEMATTNPARAGRVPDRVDGLSPGDRADLVEFRFDARALRVEVVGTWISGRRVYPA